ncbi:MAG: S-layer family protein [Tolypothrix carrinoi HA7290-LM1]|jgi:filamentous hemagglutinin family protein|nr:S-layer family protein [Tolypothrix carrinoi HA7290-LM1]
MAPLCAIARKGAKLCPIAAAMLQTVAFSASSTLAQELKPVADGTLGAESSVVTPINPQADKIDGGAIRGANLFHSFSQFHIGEGREAYFANPSGIENILSRVTGSDASRIFGKLGVLGNANLFVINPNGIIFGKNASLDVRGSFIASTASSLKFPDGTEFSALAPQTKPLLTVSVPIGLQYGANPGSIQVQGDGQGIRATTQLRVPSNQTLALVGGDVSLQRATLKTAGGRIELGSVAGEGLVSLTAINKGFALGYDGVQNFGNVQLSQQAVVDARGAGGGDIQVVGRRITLSNGSLIETSTLGADKGGVMVVKATELVELIGESAGGQFSSGLFSSVNQGATGDAGDLTINTRELLIQGGAQVVTGTFGGGKGGNLTVTADKVQLIGTTANKMYSSGLFAQANSGSSGDAGDLTVNTRELFIQDGAQVNTGTFSSGKGGNLTVTADKVQLIGASTNGQIPSGLFSSVNKDATGDAGDLTINTRELLIQDRAQVSAGTFGGGKGGNLTVIADKAQLIGRSADGRVRSGLFTQADPGTISNAGDLTINIGELLIQDGAVVSASSSGKGVAGNLSITANSVRLDNGEITAQTLSGNGGNLKLNVADLLLMRRGSEISTTAGTAQQGGDGGNITINTPSGFIVAAPSENSDITANAFTGKGGRVQINAFGIYGTQFREKQNPQTSDITASSEFGVNGTVELNTPEIDPNSGLINLPSVPVDTKLAQGCNSPNYAKSSFIITGRGGLPPNPKDILTPDAVQVDWVTLNPNTDNRKSPSVSTPTNPTPEPIVEATGWVFNAKGEVVFTASAPTTTPRSSWQTPAKCHT